MSEPRVRRLLGLLVPLASLALVDGCTTGVRGSPRRLCADAGYQPGTADFSNCWHRVRDQMLAPDLQALGTAAITVGLANAPASTPPPLNPPSVTGSLKRQYVSGMNRICVYDTIRGDYTVTVSSAELCPLRPR